MTVVSRVVALVVAVGLVVGAFALRADESGPDGETSPTGGGDAVQALCARDLPGACDAVDGARADTAERIAASLVAEGGTALLPAAWADVVADRRERQGRQALARSEVVARSPLLLVAFTDRAEVLADACGVAVEGLDWACIGEHAGARWAELGGDARWGDVRVGLEGPDTAVGLQATAQAVATRTGLPFSRSDIQALDVTTWLRDLGRAVVPLPAGRSSYLAAMRTTGPSAANVAAVIEAAAVDVDLAGASFGGLVAAVPAPRFDVELVVVGDDEDAVADVMAGLDRQALTAAGWRQGTGAMPGAPVPEPEPAVAGPSGGVLQAVQEVWEDVAR